MMVVTCADCWKEFENKRCLLKRLSHCGSIFVKQENNEDFDHGFELQSNKSEQTEVGGETSQAGQPKLETDLKTLILGCKGSVQFAPSTPADDDYRKSLKTEISTEKSIYNCGECNFSFFAIPFLIHLETHNAEKMYQCPDCVETFSYFWSLNYHFVRTHSKEKPFCCLECGTSCCSIQGLDCRWKSHSDEKAICCSKCPRYLSCGDEVKVELTSGMAMCDFCKDIFPSLSASRAHLETCIALLRKFDGQHASNLCKRKLGQEVSHQSSRKSCKADEHACCKSCERKRDRNLAQHMRSQSRDKPFYACGFCEKSSPFSSVKLANTRTHRGDKPYSCDFCGKKFSNLSSKQCHVRTHTGEKPYACDLCEKRFAHASNKLSHMRMHAGDKPYACDFCEKRFSYPSDKAAHIRKHTGEKPYSCEFCDKKFSRLDNKLSHIRTHTGEKPYACDFCEKRFAQWSNKSSHMRMHMDEKPYSCDICEKRFSWSSQKVTHIRTHTGEKPYSCDFCGKRFSDFSSKVSHMRKHARE